MITFLIAHQISKQPSPVTFYLIAPPETPQNFSTKISRIRPNPGWARGSPVQLCKMGELTRRTRQQVYILYYFYG